MIYLTTKELTEKIKKDKLVLPILLYFKDAQNDKHRILLETSKLYYVLDEKNNVVNSWNKDNSAFNNAKYSILDWYSDYNTYVGCILYD